MAKFAKCLLCVIELNELNLCSRINNGDFDKLLAARFQENQKTFEKDQPIGVDATARLQTKSEPKADVIKIKDSQDAIEILDSQDTLSCAFGKNESARVQDSVFDGADQRKEKTKSENKFLARYKQKQQELDRTMDRKQNVNSMQSQSIKTPVRKRYREFKLTMSLNVDYVTSDEASTPKQMKKARNSTVVKPVVEDASPSSPSISPASSGKLLKPQGKENSPEKHMPLLMHNTVSPSSSLLSLQTSSFKRSPKPQDKKVSNKPLEKLSRSKHNLTNDSEEDDVMASTSAMKKSGMFGNSVDTISSTWISDSDSDLDLDSLPDIGLTSTSLGRSPGSLSPLIGSHGTLDPVIPEESNPQPIAADSLREQYRTQLQDVKCFLPDVDDRIVLELLETFSGNVEAVVSTLFDEASQQ